jgi:sugar-specific transcriptional regulator TrmB
LKQLSGEADNIKSQLEQFGLSEEEVKLYIYLLSHGKLTPLYLSRKLKIARTKIYRLLEKLIEKSLVIEEVTSKGKNFRASDPTKLLNIVNKKEKELLLLKSSTTALINQLNALVPNISSETKILSYRGIEGLKQVLWNTTKVKDSLRIYEMAESMNKFVDFEFAEEIRLQSSKIKNAKFRQLTNLTRIGEFTNIIEHLKQWEVRHIPKEKLEIKFEAQIYNDVYVMYEYTKEDIFIVEIYNKDLADMQKQIFDLLWNDARKLKLVGKRGEAILVND